MDSSVDHMFTATIETIASNFGVKNYAAAIGVEPTLMIRPGRSSYPGLFHRRWMRARLCGNNV
ncbi:MAG: hypothetical protein OXC68_15370 [Aestuariivita sp.]|nr:hypothetical protein [Aestuariivita sp.]